jgi:hypothetical protein
MRNSFLVLACLPVLALSQVAKEAPPAMEENLAVSTEIETSADIEAPRMQGALKGVEENLPSARTPESVFQEVQESQSRLSYLYKTWRMREEDGVGGRTYGLVLTIRASGEVEKVVVKGPTNPDFIKEIQANVMTWNFSKVKAEKPYVANLKNLDFTFRRNRVLE